MRIYVKTVTEKKIPIQINPNDKIENLKALITKEEGIPISQQRLFFKGQVLIDGNTLQKYSIVEDSCVDLLSRLKGGGCSLDTPSSVVGLLKNDVGKVSRPIIPGKLTSRFIRNTNSSRVYEQIGETCYAYAACSAYINTIMRIYGSKEPPSFGECFEIACYNGYKGGDPCIAIKCLENHFHYGICCQNTKGSTILNVMKISLIISFSTSKKGWYKVAEGNLLEKQEGEMDEWHAAIVEGYDFDQKCLICKNSWGSETAEPRFNLKTSATHSYYFTEVYFTLDSIQGKTNKRFVPKITRLPGKIDKTTNIQCAWMDENTAIYNSDFVCEIDNLKKGPCNYLGYEINQWIYYQLFKSIDQTHFYTKTIPDPEFLGTPFYSIYLDESSKSFPFGKVCRYYNLLN